MLLLELNLISFFVNLLILTYLIVSFSKYLAIIVKISSSVIHYSLFKKPIWNFVFGRSYLYCHFIISNKIGI